MSTPVPVAPPAPALGPSPFADLYSDVIERAILDHPRSKQTAIGPSELGEPCERKLLARLAGHKQPDRGVAWKTVLGTAIHAHLEGFFEAEDARHPFTRFVVEHRVNVGEVGGQAVWGSADLYDVPTGTVADHKLVGTKQLAKYRSEGPPEVYQRQAMLYGLGFLREQGFGVPKRVAICFLPREAEWDKRFIWEAPWDAHLAIDTLNRANRLHAELTQMGLPDAQARYEPCDSPYCWTCATARRTADRGTTSLFLS